MTLPRPLRSKLYPMGLPTLRGLDAAKVASANLLYFCNFGNRKNMLTIWHPSQHWEPWELTLLGHWSHGWTVLHYAMAITTFFKVVWWVARGTSALSGGQVRQTSQLSTSYAMELINTNLGSQCKQNLAFISQRRRRRHTRHYCVSVWRHVIKEAAEALGIKQTESLLEQSQQTDFSGIATC